MQCRDAEIEIACFVDATGVPQNVFANHVYDDTGALIALYYTNAAAAVVDTSVGVVTPGACPVAQPDGGGR